MKAPKGIRKTRRVKGKGLVVILGVFLLGCYSLFIQVTLSFVKREELNIYDEPAGETRLKQSKIETKEENSKKKEEEKHRYTTIATEMDKQSESESESESESLQTQPQQQKLETEDEDPDPDRDRETGPIPPLLTHDHNIPKDGFAGCLLLKDDNDRLSEWIAYHWLTLPLKYLVVAVDPTSTTTPKHILDLWRDADMGMDIVLWDDFHYGHWINDELDEVHKHRDRQNRFVIECQRHHKARDREYVVIIDSDEFVTYNIIHESEPEYHTRRHHIDFEDVPEHFRTRLYTDNMKQIRKGLPKYLEKHITIFDYLQSHQGEDPWEDEICHLMVRLYFSAIDSDAALIQKANVSQYGLDHNTFSTLRYFHHDVRTDFGMNRYGKVLVNLKKTPWEDLARDMGWRGIHNPNFPSCDTPLKPYINGIFRVHHYLGSWEQYSARDDVRRSKEKYEEANSVDAGVDTQLQEWLHRFVEIVGAEKSRKLLQYAGILDVKKPKDGERVTQIMDIPGYKFGRMPKRPYEQFDQINHFYDENGKRWEEQEEVDVDVEMDVEMDTKSA